MLQKLTDRFNKTTLAQLELFVNTNRCATGLGKPLKVRNLIGLYKLL